MELIEYSFLSYDLLHTVSQGNEYIFRNLGVEEMMHLMTNKK